MWEAVQLEIERRRAFAERYNISKLDYAAIENPFEGRVTCGHCGSTFGRKVWNSTDERLRKKVWMCNNKYKIKGKRGCDSKHIDNRVLYQVVINTFNTMIENKNYFMEKWKQNLKNDNLLQRYKAQQFIEIFNNVEPQKEFDMDLYFKTIEKMTTFKYNKIMVTLLDGTDVECEIE